QLKQLPNPHINDDRRRQAKFQELALQNKRNKQVLTACIKQLHSEIDLLIKERKQQSAINISQAPLLANESSPLSSNSEKSSILTTGVIHHSTIISTSSSKNAHDVITKIGIVPPSILTCTQ
ncbi:unnamed protein product, partial [Rotaria sordida]